jgi:hypothetical protein
MKRVAGGVGQVKSSTRITLPCCGCTLHLAQAVHALVVSGCSVVPVEMWTDVSS